MEPGSPILANPTVLPCILSMASISSPQVCSGEVPERLSVSNTVCISVVFPICSVPQIQMTVFIQVVVYCCRSAPVWQVTIRESVVADFVYLPEVVEYPNNNKRCDAPHFIQMRGTTRLLWRHPYKMKSAVRCPVILKLPHFRQGQCENTFLCLFRVLYGPSTITKVINFHKQTTLGGTSPSI